MIPLNEFNNSPRYQKPPGISLKPVISHNDDNGGHGQIYTDAATTRTMSSNQLSPDQIDSRNFMSRGFNGFVDFTQTGISFGEKFTYGLYAKFSKWSRSWFTHIFLVSVVALYSAGGAVLFGAIEGNYIGNF